MPLIRSLGANCIVTRNDICTYSCLYGCSMVALFNLKIRFEGRLGSARVGPVRTPDAHTTGCTHPVGIISVSDQSSVLNHVIWLVVTISNKNEGSCRVSSEKTLPMSKRETNARTGSRMRLKPLDLKHASSSTSPHPRR